MNTAKIEMQSLLQKLPDDCTFEDIQYHLYVIEKVRKGIERAEGEGVVSQEEVEKRLGKAVRRNNQRAVRRMFVTSTMRRNTLRYSALPCSASA
jgi:hypothetical protein